MAHPHVHWYHWLLWSVCLCTKHKWRKPRIAKHYTVCKRCRAL